MTFALDLSVTFDCDVFLLYRGDEVGAGDVLRGEDIVLRAEVVGVVVLSVVAREQDGAGG